MNVFTRSLWITCLCASLSGHAQQTPSTPAPPLPSRSHSSAAKIGAALIVGGALAAWWADKRVDKAVQDAKDALRTTHTDSNGDTTTTQKDGAGRTLEKQKLDKHGVEKAYEDYRYEGDVCVFEQHLDHLHNGHIVHHVVHRRKDGSVISDETDEYDQGGSQIKGTRTTGNADGSTTTQTYDKDTNLWK
jgi:hypothetical protein